MNEKPKTIQFLLYLATNGNNTSVCGTELRIKETKDELQCIMNRRFYCRNYNRYYKEVQ